MPQIEIDESLWAFGPEVVRVPGMLATWSGYAWCLRCERA
jgi:hypothetical protein